MYQNLEPYEVSLSKMILPYIVNIAINQFKKNSLLPCANSLTLIFKGFNVPLLEEELVKEPLNIIDETSLINLKYEKIDDKWVHPNAMADKKTFLAK